MAPLVQRRPFGIHGHSVRLVTQASHIHRAMEKTAAEGANAVEERGRPDVDAEEVVAYAGDNFSRQGPSLFRYHARPAIAHPVPEEQAEFRQE